MDAKAIHLMSDAQLATYVPHYGDRIVLKAFVGKFLQTAPSGFLPSKSKAEDRKHFLLNSLKEKFGIDESINADKMPKSNQKGNKYAEKPTRKVDIGWLNEERNLLKRVTKPTGGGTKSEDFNKSASAMEVLQKVKQLFFPNGVNALRGNLEDFECQLVDWEMVAVPDDETVEELYSRGKFRTLRLNLKTKPLRAEFTGQWYIQKIL